MRLSMKYYGSAHGNNPACGVSSSVISEVRSGRRPWMWHNIQSTKRTVFSKAFEVDPVVTDVLPPNRTGVAPLRTVEMVKAALLDAVCGTERGLVARSEVRAEINELINQLEVKGGQLTDIASSDFQGTWELLYSNAADLISLLAVNRLPFPMRIGPVTQTIDASNSTVQNAVQLQLPMISTSLSTMSTYNIASPKRLQFTVQRGVLHTPSIEGNLELPGSVTVMGQTLDLSLLREVLMPLTRGAASLAASASDLLGQAPDLELPLQTEAWQLTTYLDPDLRITRGDGGAVYVFKKVSTHAA